MHNLVRLEDNDVCLSRKPCKIRLGRRHFQGFCLLALIFRLCKRSASVKRLAMNRTSSNEFL